MKKILFFIMALTALPAMADDYYSYDTRDNYAGIRLHKNEKLSFAYDIHDGASASLKKDNFGMGLYIGNRLTDFMKIEFETIYTGAEGSNHNIDFDYDVWANMVNMYLFREYEHAVSPYVGFGIGFSTIWTTIGGHVPDTRDTEVDLSYAAMIGVNFALNERIDLNLGFKYQKYGDVEHKVGDNVYADTDADATEFYIGAAYKFGLK